MTEEDWAYLEVYYRELAERLGLREWDLRVSRDMPEASEGAPADEVDAQSRIMETGAYSTLRVHAGFREGAPEVQRETILHELMHLFLEWVYDDASSTIEGLAAPQTNTVAQELLRRQYERVVDRLASAIAPMYPLPDWPARAETPQEDPDG